MNSSRTMLTRQQAEVVQKTVGLMVRRESLHLESKSLDGEGAFKGYASTFDVVPDLQGDVVSPRAFDETLKDWRGRGCWPPLLWNHDLSTPSASLGVITDLYTDDRGLVIEGRLDLDHEPAKAVYAAMKSGRIKTFSISYAVIKRHPEQGWIVLDEVSLLEISVVTSPANRNALLTGVKGDRRDASVELEHDGRRRGASTGAAPRDRYRCRAGHLLPEPRVLAPQTHRASVCARCGRITVYAPPSVTDTQVRSEIKSIGQWLAQRSGEIAELNQKLDALELDNWSPAPTRQAVTARTTTEDDGIRWYARSLDRMEFVPRG